MSEEQQTPKKKTRTVKKYMAFQPVPEVKNGMQLLEGAPKSSRMAEMDKYLAKEAEALLAAAGVDELVVYVFPEPIKKVIKREVKVTVS